MDKEYICLGCSETYVDGDTFCCTNCGELICPKCGGEIQTIQKYEDTMKDND